MKKKIAEQRTLEDGSISIKDTKTGKETLVFDATKVQRVSFVKYALDAYAQFAMDTLIRYIPRIEDGLRLSSRRVMYQVMGVQSLTKAARIVGEVLGKLHPHSDTAAYGALVSMCNKAHIPFAHGQGNWGNVLENEGAAAMRYPEVKAHKNLNVLLDKEASNVTPMVSNFDGTTLEPYFIMMKLPPLLLNDSWGSTVGYTMGIPSHNLIEVAEACISSIKSNFKLSPKKAASIIKAPDHRVYSCIYNIDEDEWIKIMETGIGKIGSMMQYEYIEGGIRITALPYKMRIDTFLDKLYVLDDKYKLLKDIDDQTQNDICNITLMFKKTTPAAKPLNEDFIMKLSAKTSNNIFYKVLTCEQIVEESPSLSDGASWDLFETGITTIINHHGELRKSYKLKSLSKYILKLEFDILIEQFKLEISKNPDAFFAILKSSKTDEEAINKCVTKYKVFAYEICEKVIKNGSFTSFINKDEKIVKEMERLNNLVKETQWKIDNIDKYMISELEDVIGKLGTPRESMVIMHKADKV